MDRRSFLKTSGAGFIAAAAGNGWTQSDVRPLPLIPMYDLIDGITQRIPLSMNASAHDFGTGKLSTTYGINGAYLGPVLRVKQGYTIPFDVENRLGDVATLHWHGLHIPGEIDGGPHQEIKPGQTWSPDVPIVQKASMNWYHSHTHGKTAQQVYKGLAGVMLIEDDASLQADLPMTYGVDDFTLILQDKTFDELGAMSYVLTGEVFQDGFKGDRVVINGAIVPLEQSVPKGLIRLRILNASNARYYTLSMAKGPITVIASDGGFLSSSVETATLLMSPGERFEILVDMRDIEDNTLIVGFPGGGSLGFLGELLGFSGKLKALTLRQNGKKGFAGSMPNSLAILPAADASEAIVSRSFELNVGENHQLAALAASWGNICGSGGMGINGQSMNMSRIDEHVRKGRSEIWRIRVSDQLHPFHIHGCSFRILSQRGGPPPPYAQGWKDMVNADDNWSEVLVKFDHEATTTAPYMYHCHILEHEDCGMMGQFTVS